MDPAIALVVVADSNSVSVAEGIAASAWLAVGNTKLLCAVVDLNRYGPN